MKYISQDTIDIWNSRIETLMKAKYTQETFVKAFRRRFGCGTQTMISRWHRVGFKSSEHQKEIGFPSYENMKRIADFFDVSVGYLTGETDYETFELERACKFLGIDQKTGIALQRITSGKSVDTCLGHRALSIIASLQNLITSEYFPQYIERLEELIQAYQNKQNQKKFLMEAESKIDPNILPLAYQCLDYSVGYDEGFGEIDEFRENGVVVTDELLEAIKVLDEARENEIFIPQELERELKIAKYELQEIYMKMLDNLLMLSLEERKATTGNDG